MSADGNGDFDADSLWTTASETSTFNAEWMNYLARFSIAWHWCFVGYSGRDIDILPHIADTVGTGSSIFWIDRFAGNPAAATNAARAGAGRPRRARWHHRRSRAMNRRAENLASTG